ncbi:MAG: hypothetical protein JNN00_19855, partial [Chitinophagaceae bacterium]|nr:hypothetical protein [Chitinophagaceae bacterium]
MAKQTGIIKVEGTIHGVCFYRLNGKYYARKKSSLSRERVKKSKAFAATRGYAQLFAMASVIGSAIYQIIPAAKKERKVYQRITGMAMRLLKDGSSKEQTLHLLKSKLA